MSSCSVLHSPHVVVEAVASPLSILSNTHRNSQHSCNAFYLVCTSLPNIPILKNRTVVHGQGHILPDGISSYPTTG